jgi:hypothetical protein
MLEWLERHDLLVSIIVSVVVTVTVMLLSR